MNDQVALKRVHLSTILTSSFTVKTKLSPKFLEAVGNFWRNRGINTLQINSDDLSAGDGQPLHADIHGQGGSLWSIFFEKYRKKVDISLTGLSGMTYVELKIELPGAFAVSSDDIRKAHETVESFEKYLQAECNPQ